MNESLLDEMTPWESFLPRGVTDPLHIRCSFEDDTLNRNFRKQQQAKVHVKTWLQDEHSKMYKLLQDKNYLQAKHNHVSGDWFTLMLTHLK